MAELRIPPQNLDAEKAVIGSVLIDNEVMEKIIDLVTGESFYDPKHSIIFENMLELYRNSSPIDILTLTAALKRAKKFKQVGGAAYLSELVTFVPTASNVRNYAMIVQEMSIRRNLIQMGVTLDEEARNEKDPVDSILDKLETKFLSLSSDSAKTDLYTAEKLIELQMLKADELAKNPDGMKGIPSGINSLDGILNGFHKSDLIILAARPSVGKSTLALHFARHAAVHEGKSVVFFSLEMPAIQLIERALAQQMQVNLWNIRMGKMSDSEFAKYSEGAGKISNSKLFIDETPGVNIMQLRSKARKIMMTHGLDMIVVDYLQLMQTREIDNRAQAIGDISRSLKILARELNIPIICLSQLNRAVENRNDRIPQLSDLRESGSIEQDADLVMFISRDMSVEDLDEDKEEVKVDIHIAKHRNGPIGKCSLNFLPRQQRFYDI